MVSSHRDPSDNTHYYHRDHYSDWDSSYRRRDSSPFSSNHHYHHDTYTRQCSPSIFQVRLVTGAFALFILCAFIAQFFYQLNHKYKGPNRDNPIVLLGIFSTLFCLIFYTAAFITNSSRSSDYYDSRQRLSNQAPPLEDDPWNVDVRGNYIRSPDASQNLDIQDYKNVTLRKAILGAIFTILITALAIANFIYSIYLYITDDSPPPPPPHRPPRYRDDPNYDPHDPYYDDTPNTSGGNAFFCGLLILFSLFSLAFSISTVISKIKEKKSRRAAERFQEPHSSTLSSPEPEAPPQVSPQVPPPEPNQPRTAEENDPAPLPKYSTFDLGPPPSYSTFDENQ